MALAPDVIVNAAAYTDVERAESEEQSALTINGISVGELADAARERQVPLIHYSTDYVFDGTKALPYIEEDLCAPISAYGRSKLDGELRIRNSGCAHLILRTSWVYAAAGRNFLTTMLRLATEREELRVVDDQFGAPTFAGFLGNGYVAVARRDFVERCGAGTRKPRRYSARGQRWRHQLVRLCRRDLRQRFDSATRTDAQAGAD